jgi:hypothetical protein
MAQRSALAASWFQMVENHQRRAKNTTFTIFAVAIVNGHAGYFAENK